MADSKGENDAGSLGRDDLNLYRNRVCRGKLISNLPSFELSKPQSASQLIYLVSDRRNNALQGDSDRDLSVGYTSSWRSFNLTKLASCFWNIQRRGGIPHRTTRSATAIMIKRIAMHYQANRSPTPV